MSATMKRIAIPLSVTLLGIFGALFFALRFPAVEGLGTKARLPVYHGAMTWATLMMFALYAACVIWFLVRNNERAWRWLSAWRWTIVGLWTVGAVLGFTSAWQVWDFSASSISLFDGMRADPRLMANVIILCLGLIVLLLPLVLDSRKARAFADIAFIVIAFSALAWAMTAGRALHPNNPVLNSPDTLIRILFFSMVVCHIVTAIGLASTLAMLEKKRTLPLAACLVIVAIALTGCGAASGYDDAMNVTVTDSVGRTVEVVQPVERIVSLTPAATETLFALEVDDRVVEVAVDGDYLSEVEALSPNLIFVESVEQAEALTMSEGLSAAVFVAAPTTVEHTLDSILAIGAAVGAAPQARVLVTDLKEELTQIERDVEEQMGDIVPVPMFVEIEADPFIGAGQGTLINDMLILAGGENIVTETGYITLLVEDVVAAKPYLIVFTSTSGSSIETIEERPGFDALNAVKQGRVFEVDADLVMRPGPRVIEGVRALFETILAATN